MLTPAAWLPPPKEPSGARSSLAISLAVSSPYLSWRNARYLSDIVAEVDASRTANRTQRRFIEQVLKACNRLLRKEVSRTERREQIAGWTYRSNTTGPL